MIPKRTLNREFKHIKKKIESRKNWEALLCKIALYSYTIKGYKSMHQGKHVEECFIDLLEGKVLDNDEKETFTYYGNCDFYLHSLPISLKSSIKKDGMWSKGGVYSQNFCKIFDTSRRPNSNDWKKTLEYLLNRTGWEIPILSYTYDIELNRGVLFLTSLSEMTKDKYKYDAVEDSDRFRNSMMDLFKFNGSSHYNISLRDAYISASKNKRVIEFEFSSRKTVNYVKRKCKTLHSVLDDIK